MNNKEIIEQLKESISYRSKHKEIIDEFLYAVRIYFLEKYDFHVRTLTGVTWFAVEEDYGYYCNPEHFMEDKDFKFTLSEGLSSEDNPNETFPKIIK